ncbi:hypothetical protein L6452_43736 [Arctium lappa]|uniref:Uncharacterized protein n=1 Tax=Arctium lappa TaxID=4217 RepID=A0ACB8XE92_ARCLA|nr:hypothetical protein L6452_43736 [Arctium lappa]
MDFIPKLKTERILSSALMRTKVGGGSGRDAYSEYMHQCGIQIASVYVLWFVTVVFLVKKNSIRLAKPAMGTTTLAFIFKEG